MLNRFVSKSFVTGDDNTETPLASSSSSSDTTGSSKVDIPYDGRTLYERLQENKLKKEEEFANATKLSNLIKKLDPGTNIHFTTYCLLQLK